MKKYYFWGIVGVLAVIAFGVWVGSSIPVQKGAIKTFAATDQSKPEISASLREWDLGDIAQTPASIKDIRFRNTGTDDLTLTGAKTSCGCTSVTFTIDGVESPSFQMHNNLTWTAKVKPGQEVLMKVTFDPLAMNTKGKVERYIVVSSNDPKNPQFQFKFTANVVVK